MKLSRIMTVAKKEFKDGFRDRRAIYTVLFSTLIGPIMIAFMFSQMAGQNKAAQEIQIPVVGRDYAPVLVNWLAQQSGVEVVAGPSDPEAAVRDRKADVVLVIEKGFARKFEDSSPAPVKVITDSTRMASQPKVKRVTSLLSTYSGQLASLRLIARGVSPVVASPLKVEEVEVSNGAQRAAQILGMIPMYLMLAVFIAGMQIATDSTAGERERGSLEPLLLNPIPRWQLMTGKTMASMGAAAIGFVGTLLITAKILSMVPLEDLGIRFHLGTPQMVLLIAALAPVAALGPALEVFIACFAKSFKEAQSYSAFLIFAVMAPGIIQIFHPFPDQPWMKPIPLIGQYTLAKDILSGNVPSALEFISAGIGVLLLAGVFVWMASRLFSSEKIIFSR
ncbi:MAG TPA: ABC transporter permease [Bryobacteraceae bacterium]|nr:ABC transporter permease [Bryobacteraceae bacterium]